MAYFQCGRNILHRISQNTCNKKLGGFVHPLYFTGQGVRYKKLEVILTTDMEKLGRAGETVKVAPGYFRNYLMPKLFAVPNIDKFAYLMREQRKIYQPKEEEEVKVKKESEEDMMKEYITAAKLLDNATLFLNSEIRMIQNVTDAITFLVLRRYYKVDNELREPVTKEEIIAEVARQLCVRIEPENLHMPNPLASLGEHEVPLYLPKSIPMPPGKIQWTLKVKIRRK